MKVSIAIGGRFHAFDMARQMQSRGFLRTLITSYPKFKVREWGVRGSAVRTVISHELLNRGWRLFARRFGIKRDIGFELNERFDRIAASKIPRDTDIFVAWSGMSLFCHRRAKKLGAHTVLERNSTHICFQRDILRDEYRLFGLNAQLPDPRTVDRELKEYAEADFICVPSTFALQSYLSHGISPEKVFMVPFGVDPTQFEPVPKTDSVFRVIHCGALTIRKGVHHLLQAFHELRLPNAELWLIGQESNEIRPFLEKFGGPAVHIRGTFNQAELYKQYSQGSVFCLASIEEGFAMVISQAMCCGLPAICTTNTTGSDIIRDGVDGWVIPIRDVQALKDRIRALYENPERCKQMGQSARQRILSGFTWDHYGDRMVEHYQAIYKGLGHTALVRAEAAQA